MNIQLLFHKILYRQCDGVFMRSPLRLILAYFFLPKLGNGCLKSVINKLEFHCRSKNDTSIVTENNNEAQSLLGTFNRVHQVITFTLEEKNCDPNLLFIRPIEKN